MYQVLSCGSNGRFQLGNGSDTDLSTLRPSVFLIDNAHTTSIPFQPVSIACGGNHTLILMDNGHVYAAGDNSYGQCVQSSPTVPVFTRAPGTYRAISCGWEFSVLVDTHGRVFTCGSGGKGELGLGPGIRSSPLAQVDVAPVLDVKSGLTHTVARTEDGFVGWGASRKGQLGRTNEKALWKPQKLDFGDAHGDFCVGRDFTVVYSDRITVFGRDMQKYEIDKALVPDSVLCMWSSVHVLRGNSIEPYGNNSHGQFHVGPISDSARVAVGSEHGLIWDGNTVYSWGWGEHGNCGEKDQEGVVYELNELYHGENIVLVEGGCATTWVVKRQTK